jgi:Zn-dependent peptidase ImmA (M78 family)
MTEVLKSIVHPPSPIKIGYQDVAVKVTDTKSEKLLHDSSGFYDGDHSEIFIADRIDQREVVNTLIHESLHACFFTYGMRNVITNKENEEYVCTTLSNALTQIFRDNPELIDWIKNNVKS